MKKYAYFSSTKLIQTINKNIMKYLYILAILATLALFHACDGCGNTPPLPPQKDKISIQNNRSGEEIGLLIDGTFDTRFVNDSSFVSTSPDIDLETISGTGEVIAFSNFRPPALLENINWTTNRDSFALNLQNEILIPVTVWVLRGPFSTTRTSAINWSLTTSSIWESERMGVAFDDFEIIDATGDPDAPNYFDFRCNMRTNMINDIGSKPGRINIYIVETVDGGSARGQACSIGSDFVAMAAGAGSELLAHEIGHNFGLFHTDNLPTFNRTNVMHSASNSRRYFTEGQVFRSHLLGNSALNDTYNARPGQAIRNCGHTQNDNQCPAIDKRIWEDGTFGPN